MKTDGENVWSLTPVGLNYNILKLARGRFWVYAIDKMQKYENSLEFYQLSGFHDFDITSIKCNVIWSNITFPVTTAEGNTIWLRLSELGEWMLIPIKVDNTPYTFFNLQRVDGAVLNSFDIISRPSQLILSHFIEDLVADMADVTLTPNGPRLIFSDPDDLRAPIEYDLRDMNCSYVHGHIYRGELKECVYVGMPKRTANRKHPLFTLALEAGSSDNPSTSQVFARFFLTMLNMSQVPRVPLR